MAVFTVSILRTSNVTLWKITAESVKRTHCASPVRTETAHKVCKKHNACFCIWECDYKEMRSQEICMTRNSRQVNSHCTSLLTHSMQQSPSWEANWFSASQEIPRILLKPKVHYRIYKCPPPVPILSQLDPVHTPHISLPEDPSLLLSSHLHLGLPSGLLPSGFPTKTLYTPLLSRMRTTCPAHLILTVFL